MVRLIRTLSVLSVGSWFSFATVQQSVAQQSIDMAGDTIRIADLGLEKQIPSAIDLIGPENGSAGRNRAALVHRLQCWIDGVESCLAADPNDARVRAMRRFLGFGPSDRDGEVTIGFPDRSSIEVNLVRTTIPDSDDMWSQAVYEPAVMSNTAQAPGLPSVPTERSHLDIPAHDLTPEIRAALQRLKERLHAPAQSGNAAPAAEASTYPTALAQDQLQ